MANWKQVYSEFPEPSEKIAKLIGPGLRTKILDCVEMQGDSKGNKTLAIRIKECEGWVRLSRDSCQELSVPWGPESDGWIQKDINIRPKTYKMKDGEQKSYVVTPATKGRSNPK